MNLTPAQKSEWTRYFNFEKKLFSEFLSDSTVLKLVRIEQLMNDLTMHLAELPESPFDDCKLEQFAERFVPYGFEGVHDLDGFFEDMKDQIFSFHVSFQDAVDHLCETYYLIQEGSLPAADEDEDGEIPEARQSAPEHAELVSA